MRRPDDPCSCGHTRNQHAGYGLGRCLVREECECEQLTPPVATQGVSA